MASVMSIYHRTGRPHRELTEDVRRVLEAVGRATPFEEVVRALGSRDCVDVLACLAALEAQGLVESVPAQWLDAACDFEAWEPAPLA